MFFFILTIIFIIINFFSLKIKELINLGCIGCMKLTTQVEFLKTKIISLQDELLLAQKEIIGYKSGLNDNVNKE